MKYKFLSRIVFAIEPINISPHKIAKHFPHPHTAKRPNNSVFSPNEKFIVKQQVFEMLKTF
jgi:hypothetical protein